MTLLAALVVLALPQGDAAPAQTPDVCRTRACERRVAHRHTRRRWRALTAPYRPWLRRVRMCESGGAYTTNTGNGFYGAYQFTIASWHAAGGTTMPHLAEPLEQDARAVRLLHMQGRGAWPICG